MGVRPCFCCGRRFVGRAQHLYVTVINGADDVKAKGPMCPRCFDRKTDWLAMKAYMVPADGVIYDEALMNSAVCPCGKPALENHCVFATDYATKSDRRDWYAQLCQAHTDDAILSLCLQQLDMPLNGSVRA